jgi:hypothetical protein
MLSKWGTTPGGKLCGLRTQAPQGGRLTYRQALQQACFRPERIGQVSEKRLSVRRKITAFLTGGAVLISVLYGNCLPLWTTGIDRATISKSWVQYTSSVQGFTVAFPKPPQKENKELIIPNTDTVLNYQELSTEQGGLGHYSVSYLELPSMWRLASNTTLLKGVLDAIIHQHPGTVVFSKEFKLHNGMRVLDYRISVNGEESQGRLIVVGKTMYKLTVTSSSSTNTEEVNSFLNSFAMT